MREYFTLHRSVFPSYLTTESGRIICILNYTIHMYSGITSGRVLDRELLYTKILEVNLFVFAYRLFYRDSLHSTGLLSGEKSL